MSAVFELRQYTLHPGTRDVLIDLFEREFIETQEATGMELVGQFRDLDDPDRFVWIRGFADMVARKKALSQFYGGPAWAAHRDAANATMIDSDNVLLLRLADRSAFPARIGAPALYITVCSFDAPIDQTMIESVRRKLNPLTLLQTEYSDNTFPRLPVRAGENVVVALTTSPSDCGASQRLRLEPTPRSRLR